MARPKKKRDLPVSAKQEKEPQRPDPREEEQFHLPKCMECGRRIPDNMKCYTVKSSIGFGTTVVCPICASKPGIRLKTPYISFDGLRMIELMGGREE